MHAVVEERIAEVRARHPEAAILDNFASWEETIKFIQSCEAIVTNSFHGAYWATLLKRKVVAIPTSSKFFSFKHPVVLRDLSDWQSGLSDARIFDDALEECVRANLEFASSVIDFLSP
jgi:exopolysaccharide biosynthesis predicted pyruvyltransferase EpsI